MARFCPRCGRETRITIDGLCPQCYVETRHPVRLPERLEFDVCKYCGSVRLGRRWVQVSSFREAVEAIVGYAFHKARKDPRLEGYRVTRVWYETLPNWLTRIELRLEAFAGDERVEWGERLEVRLNPTICPVCKTRVSGEYDTVLQIRGPIPARGDPEEWILGEAEKLGITGQLVDIIAGKDGVDVYFTNTGAARKLAKRIMREHGGTLSRSVYEQVTITSTGKPRARKTLVLRLPGEREQ